MLEHDSANRTLTHDRENENKETADTDRDGMNGEW